VKDEQTFSTITFMKPKLQHQLAKHFDIAICMFVQKVFIEKKFPFKIAITNWNYGDKFKIRVNDELQALDLESRVEECKRLHLHNHILFFVYNNIKIIDYYMNFVLQRESSL